MPGTSSDLSTLEYLTLGLKGLSTEDPEIRLSNSAVWDAVMGQLPLKGDAAHFNCFDNPVSNCLANATTDLLRLLSRCSFAEREFIRLQEREKRASMNLQNELKRTVELSSEKKEVEAKLAAAENELKNKDEQLVAQVQRVSELEAELERVKAERFIETRAWVREKERLEAMIVKNDTDYERLGLAMFEYGKNVIAKYREVALGLPLELLNEVPIPDVDEEEEPANKEGGGDTKKVAEEETADQQVVAEEGLGAEEQERGDHTAGV